MSEMLEAAEKQGKENIRHKIQSLMEVLDKECEDHAIQLLSCDKEVADSHFRMWSRVKYVKWLLKQEEKNE